MATVYSIHVCPDCKGELPSPIPEFCPHCSTDSAYRRELRRARVPGSELYRYPEPLFTEYENKLKELHERAKHSEEAMNSLSSGERALRAELTLRYRAMKPETARGIMIDAIHILKNCLHSGHFPEELMAIVAMGKKVGKMADAAHSLIVEHSSTPSL